MGKVVALKSRPRVYCDRPTIVHDTTDKDGEVIDTSQLNVSHKRRRLDLGNLMVCKITPAKPTSDKLIEKLLGGLRLRDYLTLCLHGRRIRHWDVGPEKTADL